MLVRKKKQQDVSGKCCELAALLRMNKDLTLYVDSEMESLGGK